MDRRKFMIAGGSLSGLLLADASFLNLAQAAESEGVPGGVLRLVIQPEPPVVVAAFNQQGPTQYVSGKMFQSLMTYSTELEPQPGLAKSWDVSDDGTEITFHLQEGVTWHDGEPFTADDVVFSMGELLPKVHARARAILNTHMESIEKVDDLTVRLKLKHPFPAVMLMFEPGFAPMMPKHIYEGTDYAKNPANEKPIGTGPFMFKEWQRGSFIRLVKNPNYWKPGRPYLDEIIFNVIPDSASRAVAFQNGDLDALNGGDVDYVDVQRLKGMPGVESTFSGWEMFSPLAYMIFNMRNAPLDNVLVRRAIMHAMDRDRIVENIFFKMGSPAKSPFVPTELYYDGDMPEYEYDMDKAKALIEESGVTPSQHTIQLLSFPYGSQWERLDEYIRQALQQLGFKVNLVSTDGGGWAASTGNWDFDITVTYSYQYGHPALGVERLYVARNIVKGSPFANVEGYDNPELDKVWAQASEELDPEKAQALYSEAQKKIVEDAPLGFLIAMQFPQIYRGNVKNLVTTAIGYNESFDDVYFADK